MEASINSKKINRRSYPIPCLPNTISLSDNVLRYFILKDKYANVSGNLIDEENYGIPLFLARDIFSTCDLLQGNVQRIHARYSKEGLATKVFLEDFRIDGITQNKMWFYSIQGLFEVIFHYHGRGVQEDCLKLLANLWLQHSKDKRLPEAISVKLEEESANILLSQQNLFSTSSVKHQAANNKSVSAQKSPDPGKMGKSSKGEVTLGCCTCNDKISSNDNHNTQMLKNTNRETSLNVCTQTDDDINAEPVHKLNVKPYHVYTQTDDVVISVIPLHKLNVKSYNVYTQTSIVPVPKIKIKNVCTQTDDVIKSVVPDDNIKIKTCHMEVQTDDITNTFVTGELDDSNNHDFSDMVTSQIEDQYNERECNEQTEDVTKCPYCLYLSRQRENQNTEFSTFLIKLNQFIMFIYSDTELEFLQMFSKLMSFFLDRYPVFVFPQSFINEFLEEFHLDETFIAENCEVKFLNFVCKWTGKELHKFGKEISQKVKIFMQNHIQCIDNLPPPENIIDEIFPFCMKQLILNWINPDYSDTWSTQDCHNVDLYGQGALSTKRCRLDNKPNFHVIQLILEFANNALISGVAHVVYSRIQLANY